jgi:hypothetical protein
MDSAFFLSLGYRTGWERERTGTALCPINYFVYGEIRDGFVSYSLILNVSL